MGSKTENIYPVFRGKPVETVRSVCLRIVRRPWESLILQWNWKSAIFSSLIRGNIFFWVTLQSGWRAAVGAFAAELSYRGISAGFYGALTQAFRSAEPAWAAAITVMILLPLSSHSIELLVHLVRHTPHLKANIISSVTFTAISTLFNWFAMRRGSLIVGSEGRTVAADLASMPRLIGCFVAAGPIALWKLLRPWVWPERFPLRSLHEPEDASSD